MKDRVYMITQLDSEYGYDVGRRLFVLSSLNNSSFVIKKIIFDKNVKGMYTTSREVLYS